MTDSPDPWAAVTESRREFWSAVRKGPVFAVVALLLVLLRVPWAAGVVAVAYFVWVGIRAAPIEDQRCPRCGNELFRNGMYHNQFASRCLHCRQEIGAPVARLVPHPGSTPRAAEITEDSSP